MPTPAFNAKRGLSARASGIQGRGVYARDPIPAGTRIIEYRGERISVEEAEARYPEDFSGPHHTFLFSLDDGTIIDAGHRGNLARWINHSCDPNCETVIDGGRVYVESIRDIAAGEELSYDYNIILEARHTPAMKKHFPCICGAPGCRGTLLGKKR